MLGKTRSLSAQTPKPTQTVPAMKMAQTRRPPQRPRQKPRSPQRLQAERRATFCALRRTQGQNGSGSVPFRARPFPSAGRCPTLAQWLIPYPRSATLAPRWKRPLPALASTAPRRCAPLARMRPMPSFCKAACARISGAALERLQGRRENCVARALRRFGGTPPRHRSFHPGADP